MIKMQIVGKTVKEVRRDRRVERPSCQIELDGMTYTTDNWSLGGFLIGPYQGPLRPGDTTDLTIIVAAGEQQFCHSVTAIIVRIEARSRKLAAHFIRLPPDAITTLEGLLTGRLRRAALRVASD